MVVIIEWYSLPEKVIVLDLNWTMEDGIIYIKFD